MEHGQWPNFANTKLMYVLTLREETLIILLKFWLFLHKFDLTQNEFKKPNYLELYTLDLLSNTIIDVFAKFIKIMLSIFYHVLRLVG